MAFRNTAAELTRQYTQNRNDIEEIYEKIEETNTKVDTLTVRVDELSTRVDGLSTRFDARFDRLERILAPSSGELDATSPLDFLPSEQEQSIRLLQSKMNLYSNYARSHTKDIERLNQLTSAHDIRFDSIDSQMAEVLEILRGKSV